MAKKKIEVEMYSYGEYTQWNKESKALPQLVEITDRIAAKDGTEFGYVLYVKKAKGKRIFFRIEHPSFRPTTRVCLSSSALGRQRSGHHGHQSQRCNPSLR